MIAEDWNHRKQVAKERLQICKTCEKYDSITTSCKECGCILLIKTMLRFSECPLKKWGKDEISTDTN